jgi:hypothetical protein
MPIKVKGTEIVDDNRNIKNADGSQITGIVTTAIQGTGGIIVSPSKGNVVVSYPSTSYWVEDSVGINTSDKVGIGTDSDEKLSAYRRTSFSDSNFDPFYDYSLVLKESLSFESGVKIGVGAGENTSVSSGTSSIYIGYNAGRDSVGSDNYFVGYCAGSNTTGSFNISIGSSSGRSSSGSDNIFVGESAGEYNKSDNNIFYGNNAGQYNCANSSYNIAIGQSSGKFNDGNCNIFFGNSSGECNSGNANISFGDLSGQCKSGSENVSLGSSSGQFNVGSHNISLGTLSSQCIAGSDNISLGTGSGQCTIGFDNISLGTNSGKCTAGDSNISLGTCAGERNTGDRGIFLGCCSGFFNTADDQIFIGNNVAPQNSSGNKNIFVGNCSGYCNSTGSFNIFLGKYSGYNHTCNNENIFIGRYAGYSNGDANQNIFVGECSGVNNVSGEKNIFFGECSGLNNLSGEKNIFFGPSSGRDNASGNRNINIGIFSGRCVTDKDENIFIGTAAGCGSRGQGREIIIGFHAGCGYYSGSKNIFIGRYAGAGYFTLSGYGSHKRYVYNNIFIGELAGLNGNSGDQGNACNNIVIGSSGCLKDVCNSMNLSLFTCPSLYSKSLLMTYQDSSSGPDNIEIGTCGLVDNSTGHNIILGMPQKITYVQNEWNATRCVITGCPPLFYCLCPLYGTLNPIGNTCYHIGLGHMSYSGQDNCNNIMIGAFSASTYNSDLAPDANFTRPYATYDTNVSGLAFYDSQYAKDVGKQELVTLCQSGYTCTCYRYISSSPDGITDVDDCGCALYCRTHKGYTNRIGIGNTLHTHFYTKMAANSGGSDVSWSSSTNVLFAQSSSRRFKTNIRPFLGGIKETLQLNPVRYKAIEDPNGRDHIGFIAEEVDETDVKEFVVYDENQEPLSVSYDKMVALLTNTIKELNKENEDMMNQIEELETMVNNHI